MVAGLRGWCGNFSWCSNLKPISPDWQRPQRPGPGALGHDAARLDNGLPMAERLAAASRNATSSNSEYLSVLSSPAKLAGTQPGTEGVDAIVLLGSATKPKRTRKCIARLKHAGAPPELVHVVRGHDGFGSHNLFRALFRNMRRGRR